jgi:photosystem II stability/assembly factor-like uncharacterized protein
MESFCFPVSTLIAMKHFGMFCLVLLLLGGSFCRAQQWNPINIHPEKHAVTFDFLTDDLGYAIMQRLPFSQRTLEKTTDGGLTWNALNLPGVSDELQAIDFTANGVGVLVVRNLGSATTPTLIYQTPDDGVSWQDISPDTTATGIGTAVCAFIDQDTGFVASGERIHATFDGGANWTTTIITAYPMSMDFVDGMHGIIGLFDGTFSYLGGIMTTTDGGATWTTTWLTQTGTVIGEVGQWTSTLAYAAPVKYGSYGPTKFFTTSNNGASWDTVYVPDTLQDARLSDIHFPDPLNGVIAVSNFSVTLLYETTDGGGTWTLQDSMPWFDITDLELTAQTGYLGGEVGKIYKQDIVLGAEVPGLEAGMRLFPNPVAAGERVRWEGLGHGGPAGFAAVSLMDASGRVVWAQDLQHDGFRVPPVAAGVYMVRFSGVDGVRAVRLMVE